MCIGWDELIYICIQSSFCRTLIGFIPFFQVTSNMNCITQFYLNFLKMHSPIMNDSHNFGGKEKNILFDINIFHRSFIFPNTNGNLNTFSHENKKNNLESYQYENNVALIFIKCYNSFQIPTWKIRATTALTCIQLVNVISQFLRTFRI